MKLKELIKINSDYRDLKDKRNKTIGSILKHYRKKRNLTLKEACKGNVSISYLSKVENNIITPNNNTVLMLKELLEIPDSEFQQEKKECPYINEILKKEYVPKKLLISYQQRNDYEAKLVRFMYEVLNKEDYDASKQIANDLKEYYPFFEDDELAFFFYGTLKLNFLNERYFTVIEIYKEIKLLYDNPLIRIKAMELVLKSLYKLGLYNEALTKYEYLNNRSYIYGSLTNIEKLKHGLIYEKAKLTNVEEQINEIEIYNLDFNINLIKFNQQFYYNKNYRKALKYIANIKNDKDYFYLMYLITLDKLNEKDQLKRALFIDDIKYFKQSYQYIIKYLKEKHLKDKIDNDTIMEMKFFNIITQDYYLLKYVYEELINYYNKNHKYKSSSNVYEKLLNFEKKKASIMLCHN